MMAERTSVAAMLRPLDLLNIKLHPDVMANERPHLCQERFLDTVLTEQGLVI